jgi:uncharacterized protein
MGAVPSHAFVRNLDDAVLPDLWRRRTRLSADEMVSMVELVKRALRTYHPPELQALGEDKEELVAQFIYAKVLRLAPGHTETHACADSAPSNGYAVCAYFRRYLIDCLRSAGHQRNVSMENEGMAQEIDLHWKTRSKACCCNTASTNNAYAARRALLSTASTNPSASCWPAASAGARKEKAACRQSRLSIGCPRITIAPSNSASP